MQQLPLRQLVCLLLPFFGRLASAQLQYLQQPNKIWDRTLGSNVPAQGNAVVLSPDESFLHVTASNGNLMTITPNNGELVGTFSPPASVRPGWTTTCQSGIAVSDDYMVYAIIDRPPAGNFVNVAESRVVAVNHGTLSTRWVSEPLVGEIVGTPVISSDGDFVLFTRNELPPPEPPTAAPTVAPTTSPTTSPLADTPAGANLTETPTGPESNSTGRWLQQNDDDLAGVTGYFTILADFQDGAQFFEQASDSASLLISNPKYGPIAIARNVTQGMYSTGLDNRNTDVVVWHSDGSTTEGETQLFQFPNVGNLTAIDPSTLTTRQLGSSTWTSRAAPVLTENGEEMFIGASNKQVEGWVDGELFEFQPNFNVPLSGGSEPRSVILSTDESLLFVTSNDALDAVNIAEESVEWNIVPEGDNIMPFLTKPVLSPDGLYVYYSMGSKLFAIESENGSNYWEVDNFDGTDVQADFTVSADGQFLYYVGNKQNFVTAYRIGFLEESPMPSVAPTMGPTVSAAPSPVPSLNPTSAPISRIVEVQGNSDEEDNTAVIAGVVGGVLGGVALLGLAAYFWKKRGAVRENDDFIDPDYNYDNAPPSSDNMRPPAEQVKPKRYSYDPTQV